MPGRIKKLFLLFLLIPLWVFLRSVYRDRIGAFGCFDDCNNIMGGYFLLQGKHLFSEIFFNHMPLMAHMSAAIQATTNPQSIYMLIYEHRMALIYFFIIADVFLVLRFGFVGFGFALLYESTKGFLFGERFLAESIIVYPLVYLLGVVLLLFNRKKVSLPELWLSVLLTWFVIFMREPYIPLVLWLFGTIVWFHRKTIWAWWGTVCLIVSSAISVLYYGFGDFIFNVLTVNRMNIATEATIASQQSGGVASIVLYPLQLFWGGSWNLFRHIEVSLMILVITSVFYLRKIRGAGQRIVFLCVTFTLANIRPTVAGAVYYGSFHHLIWYAFLVYSASFLSFYAYDTQAFQLKGKVFSKLDVMSVLLEVAFAGIGIYAIFSPQSYLYEKVDRQTEFTTNYGNYYVGGEVVKRLASSKDTLFLDGQDDLIYWQAKLPSSYRYSWYTSLMPFFPVYTQARDDMFVKNPPVFYFGQCKDAVALSQPPDTVKDAYVRLLAAGKPSCLWVHKDRYNQISDTHWKSVGEFQYQKQKDMLQ